MTGFFPWEKDGGEWSWRLTAFQFQAYEYVELYLNSTICLPGVHRFKFTVTFYTFKRKLIDLPIQRHVCCLYIERTSRQWDLECSNHLSVLSLHNFKSPWRFYEDIFRGKIEGLKKKNKGRWTENDENKQRKRRFLLDNTIFFSIALSKTGWIAIL
jgi:hypothetical protein